MIFQLEIHRDFDDDRIDIVVESENIPTKERIMKFINDMDIGYDEKYHKYYLSQCHPKQLD
jgi:hypothetical protein